jgi:hypothetical protein
MKIEDYRQTFYTFSGKASDICRQLAFGGHRSRLAIQKGRFRSADS